MKRFKIYRSSAGSGKTFTLTKEYLKLLVACPALDFFSPNYFRHILAVTFTNDAANEMKQRILESLQEIAQNPDHSPLADLLIDEIAQEYPEKILDKTQLQSRAKSIYENILHSYSDFAVSTIDAFSNRVVRAFTKDLDLPYNYDIELDTEDLLKAATENLLALVGKPSYKDLSDILMEFAEKRAENSENWNLESSLIAFGENLFAEDKQKLLASLQNLSFEMLKDIKNQLYDYQNNIEKKLQNIAQTALRLIDQNGLTEKDFFQGKKGVFGYLSKIVEQFDTFDFTKLPSYVQKSLEENKWASGNKTTDKNAVDNFGANTLRHYVEQIDTIRTQEANNYIIVKNLLPKAYLIVLLAELDRQLYSLMQEKNQVHLSQFNQKINEIVEKEPVPYLYERLGERFHHILIDEFQDTSRMQWHNLIPLMSNALAKDQMNLIVGDAKQAIYRWRKGDSELLVRLPQVPSVREDSPLQEDLPIFELHAYPQNLQTNWRSKKNIVDFNNEFFTYLTNTFAADFPDLARYYQEVRQEGSQKEGGEVVLKILADNNYREESFLEVQKIIGHLLAKNYAYEHIAILCRRNSDASFLAQKLLEQKIPVVSSESLLLQFSPKIRFIVHFMEVMTQVLKPQLKFELIYFLFAHLGISLDASLHEEISEVCNHSYLSEFLKFIRRKTGIRFNFKSLQYLSIYEIGEEIIRLFGLNNKAEEQIYLQKLLDLLLDFGLKHSNNLPDFIAYWYENKHKIAISSPQNSKAVQIMSIHKSKGLQFPAVIVPFADWELKPKTNATVWVDWSDNTVVPQLQSIILPVKKELLATQFAADYLAEKQAAFIEGINMLYVALTRAENALFVLTQQKELKKNNEQEDTSQVLNVYAQNFECQIEENNTQIYNFAQDQSPFVPKEKAFIKNYVLQDFISSECRDKIRMRRDDLQIDSQRQISIAELHQARIEGKIMHTAFEKIRYREDVISAVRFLVNKGLLKASEVTLMQNKIFELIDLPLVSPFFERKENRKVRNEGEMMTKKGTVFRPDRLVIDKDSVLVLDYKTGNPQQEHQAQITHYAQLLQDMGYQNIRKILLYTEIGKALEI